MGALALACASLGVAHAEGRAQPAAAVDQLPPGQDVSDTVVELAGWVVGTRDNHGYPFAILDKAAAQIFVFGGDGRLRGAAPGLFGSAIGDHTAPGVAGLALRAVLVGFTNRITGDGVGWYIPMARAFVEGRLDRGFDAYIPPVYSLSTAAVAKILPASAWTGPAGEAGALELADFRLPASRVWRLTVPGERERPAAILTLWPGIGRVDAVNGMATVVFSGVQTVDLVPGVEAQFRRGSREVLIVARRGKIIVRA